MNTTNDRVTFARNGHRRTFVCDGTARPNGDLAGYLVGRDGAPGEYGVLRACRHAGFAFIPARWPPDNVAGDDC